MPTSPGGSNTAVPTLGKLKVEYDAEGFHTLEGVPIFDAHSGEDEGLDVDFDEKLLRKICAQCNARVKDTGDLVPVTDRHTSDDTSSPDPDILGYAHNFRMGTIGKLKPRPAILCDMRIYKTKMQKVKRLPRRSIELWSDFVIDPVVLKGADKPAIDSVALLGSQRPARDLGMLFQKNASDKYKYRHEVQCAKETMNPEELIKQCVEALSNTPEFAYIRELMEKQKMEMDEEPDAYSAEEAEDEKAEDEKVKMDKEDEEDCAPAKLRMQRDQERRKYARLEAQHKSLFAKVDALERDNRVAVRRADLLSLEGEGYDLDLSEELPYVADMDVKRYSAHLSKIRKHYRKAPINVNITPARVSAEGGKQVAVASPQDVYASMSSHYKSTRTLDKIPQEAN